LIIVAAVAIFMVVRKSDSPADNGTASPTISGSASPSPSPVAGNDAVDATQKPVSAALKAYTDLVAQYEGRRIQFDKTCQAIPSSLVLKNGTKVMFDNRSGDARMITVGAIQYSFSGYGWRLITLSSPTLPATIGINCGSAIYVGSITLQK